MRQRDFDYFRQEVFEASDQDERGVDMSAIVRDLIDNVMAS